MSCLLCYVKINRMNRNELMSSLFGSDFEDEPIAGEMEDDPAKAHDVDEKRAPNSANSPITISALSTHIVALFERDTLLRDVWVSGEVSNWKRAASGHIYFSLKDSGATVNAVMWKGSALSHTWLPKAGDQILAHGYVGVYPERGAYQLYVKRIQPAGRGQLYAQFEALKQRLADAGLFDPDNKRPIPQVPSRIAVVTSPDAAALRDILRVLTLRWPLVDVVVFGALVQGNEAPTQIVRAIQAANRYSIEVEPVDTILLARGGGSIEDLWSFNAEEVAHAVAESKLPIICGVGHETDFTIADFVADLRAPTPSAAAAAATPDRSEGLEQFLALRHHFMSQAMDLIDRGQDKLERQQSRLALLHPQRQIDQRRQRLDELETRLHGLIRMTLARRAEQVKATQLQLNALNPKSVLERGFSIVQTAEGNVVTDPQQTNSGDALEIQSAGGSYSATRA